jgi:hypothetical protein
LRIEDRKNVHWLLPGLKEFLLQNHFVYLTLSDYETGRALGSALDVLQRGLEKRWTPWIAPGPAT